MKNTVSSMVILLALTSIISAAELEPVTVLGNKILKNLENEQWDSSSKTFLLAFWNEYKQAHLYTTKNEVTRGISGKMPDIKDYSEYIGTYTSDRYQGHPFVEISKDANGRFYVTLDEHKIPCALTNKCIICTTGDVVHSRIPQFGEKPYCTLEMFMIIHTNGKFYFASPESPSDQWMEIKKMNSTQPNIQSETEVTAVTMEEETNWKREYEILHVVNQNLEGQLMAQKQLLQELADRITKDQQTIKTLQEELQKNH